MKKKEQEDNLLDRFNAFSQKARKSDASGKLIFDETYIDKYDEFISDTKKGSGPAGGFLRAFKEYIRMFGCETAVFIAYLIEKRDRFRRHEEERARKEKRQSNFDGWFYLTVKRVERDLNFNKVIQQRIFKKLKKWQFAETRNVGYPPKRHIRINKIRIYDLIMWTRYMIGGED